MLTTKDKPKLQTGLNINEIKKDVNIDKIKNLDRFLELLKIHHEILTNLKINLGKNFNPYDSIKIYLDFI